MFRVQHSLRYSIPIMGAAAFSMFNSGVAHAQQEDVTQAFSPKEFRSFPIRKVTTLSHNTKAVEVALPSSDHHMVWCIHFLETENTTSFSHHRHFRRVCKQLDSLWSRDL
jgi:hypothetical protein